MIPLIQHIPDFFATYFEEILLLNAFCLVFGLILFMLARFDIFNKKSILGFINGILYRVLIIGEVFLLIFTGYVYWLNYRSRPLLSLEQRLVYRTDWVNDNLTVFFIAGNSLVSIKTNGADRTNVFNAPEEVREYHFSPDGRYIAVVTDSQLYLIRRKGNKAELIDEVKKDGLPSGAGYVFRAVSWAPDSQKLCYERSVWSQYSNQDQFYIYDVTSKQRFGLKTMARQVPFLFWDKTSTALYFFQNQAQDTSQVKSQFWIKLFKIPLDTKEPVFVRQRPSTTYDLDLSYFTSLGADIFYEGSRLSFDRIEDDSSWASAEGPRLGVDKDDYLYYLRGRWWRKRLFKIPRELLKGSIPRYQYKDGPIALHHVRWLPGAHYVIMEHDKLGILILDPRSGRVGQLTYSPGHTFGWYMPLDRMGPDSKSALERLNIKHAGGK